MNLDAVLKNLDGTDAVQSNAPFKLRDALQLALMNADPQKYQSPEAKLSCYKLLRKCEGSDVKFTAEEIVLLKDTAAHILSILIYGQVVEHLGEAG